MRHAEAPNQAIERTARRSFGHLYRPRSYYPMAITGIASRLFGNISVRQITSIRSG
jgi:hypothetical protein